MKLSKIFKISGFLLLESVIVFNFTNLELPQPLIIAIGIAGVVTLIGGVYLDKTERNDDQV